MLEYLKKLFKEAKELNELNKVKELVGLEINDLNILKNEINTKIEEFPVTIIISRKELNLLTNLLSRHDFIMDYRWRGITNYRDVDFLINKLNKYGN